jgi:hypothetical protein
VRVFGGWKTVVALVSCVELEAHVDGATSVWVPDVELVSDVCVAVGDGIIVGWVTTAELISDVCLADDDELIAVWATADVLDNDGYVVAHVD